MEAISSDGEAERNEMKQRKHSVEDSLQPSQAITIKPFCPIRQPKKK
jgi:hypothetical protein